MDLGRGAGRARERGASRRSGLGKPHGDALDALRRIVQRLHLASRDVERSLGITGAQLFVLSQLRDTPELSISALAERTLTHQSTVSVVVRRLEERGLVKKRRSADDGRRQAVSLTPAGARLLARAPVSRQQHLARAMAGLPTSSARALARTLTTLADAIGASRDTHAMLFFEPPRGARTSAR